MTSIDSADIVCTTPEKFDAMTRRHRERGGMRFFGEVGAKFENAIIELMKRKNYVLHFCIFDPFQQNILLQII